MASQAHHCRLADDEPAEANLASRAPQPPPQREYDFVERPSEDYFCPVTLDLLLDPRQTACCGHHLSHEAATQLQREGKPCPMCKEPNLATVVDKFFKRKVNELKVRCPHKGSGCEWVGEVGSLDQHDRACPKRPWECEHCQEKGVYENREGHMPKCTQYPTPCPNNCDVGTVARCRLDDHVAMCPLQPVVCEFSHAGCKVVVPRREMAQHMEEGAQQHLLAATLLNLSLTREMRGELQGKMEEMEGRLQGKMEETQRKMDEKDGQTTKLQGQVTKLQEQVTDLKVHVLMLQDTFNFTLTGYEPKGIDWYSAPFYVPSHGYKLQLNIDNPDGIIRAYLYILTGENDDHLSWPVTVTGRLTLLNQLGDHEHHSVGFSTKLALTSRNNHRRISDPFIPPDDLGHNAERGTQYLKDNRLCFRLHITVSPQ